MGNGIAHIFASAGFTVVLCDIKQEFLDRGIATITKNLDRESAKNKITAGQREQSLARIRPTTDRMTLSACDFIIEAIPEKLELKQEVFKELDGVVKPGAIFASNTSGFVIEEVARDVSESRKPLFVGMHFSNPVTTMRMCEVIYTPQTSEDTIDATKRMGEAMGKVISMVKDAPGTYGFLLNRIFGAARREALAIVEAGIATREDIDKAMITGRNWPAGFFGARGGIGKEW